MDIIHDSHAENTTTSLVNPDGNLSQHSERDVVPQLGIQVEQQSLETSEAVLILMALLNGIIKNTVSGDVIEFGVDHAKRVCKEAGISDEKVKEVFAKFSEYHKKARANTPYAY